MKINVLIIAVLLSAFIIGCHKSSDDENTLSFDEIQNKLTSARDGDTVIIPAGTCIVHESIIINKNISIIGEGIDKTKFRTDGKSDVFIMTVDNSSAIRISGMSFIGAGGGEKAFIHLRGNNDNIRIDHCRFTEGGAESLFIWGVLFGVIDHCEFYNDATISIHQYALNANIHGDMGTYMWGDGVSPAPDVYRQLGNLYALYIEDCNFTTTSKTRGGCAIATCYGSKYVFRRNILKSDNNYTMIDCHGPGRYNQWLTGTRGSYSVEIYDNTIQATATGYGCYCRGGRGVVCDNTFTGSFNIPICLMDYSSYNYNDLSDKTSSALCTTYPTPDQINNFYIWTNTINGAPISDGSPAEYVPAWGLLKDHIQSGRDFFQTSMPGYSKHSYPHPLNK
jgi:hypothetical protein